MIPSPTPTPAEDGVFLTWQSIQWGIGATGTVLALAFVWILAIGRKLGGFERSFAMLESRVESNRLAAQQRADKLDDRLDAVDESNRKIENAVYGLPGSLSEIKETLREMGRRIDEVVGRRAH